MVLLSTLHDPQGMMIPVLETQLAVMRTLYSAYVVVATPVTSAETLAFYHDHDCDVRVVGSAEIGTSRRKAIRAALDHDGDFFQYCDADRILHWHMHYPDELRQVVQTHIPRADYTALGRTPRAFATHPLVQREAEYVTNRVFSLLYGERETVLDICAGACGFSRRAGVRLVNCSAEPTNATDTEWPMLIAKHPDFSLSFVQTDGLEFETPTFFGKDVYQQAHSADNWARRVRLAIDSIEAAARL